MAGRRDPRSAGSLIRATSTGVEIDVRVVPRSRKSEVSGIRDNALLIRLAAPPVEGAANEALGALLATTLNVPRRGVRIVAGERSRQKRVAIDGVTVELVKRVLQV